MTATIIVKIAVDRLNAMTVIATLETIGTITSVGMTAMIVISTITINAEIVRVIITTDVEETETLIETIIATIAGMSVIIGRGQTIINEVCCDKSYVYV